MLSRKLGLTILALLIVGALLLTACGGTADDEEAAGDGEPLTIGAVFNATGWMAAYDQPPRSSAVLAVDALNAEGGLLGREVEIIELDGQTDPATVGNAALQLIEQGAEVIIAPCDFDIGGPASQAAQEAGLVGISTCASSPLYGSEALGDKQFTLAMWNNIMGAAAAEYAYEDLGWRTAYVVTDTSIDYSLSLGEYMAEHFAALGGEVLGEDTFLNEDQDFSAQIQRLQGASQEPDGLFISSYMPGIGTIVRQIRSAGIETPIMGGDAYDTTEFFDVVGSELGNEIYFATHSYLGAEAGDHIADFIGVYEEAYDQPPDSSFIVMGWDTVMVLAQAIEEAGTTDGAAVAQAMEDLEFEGLLSGRLNWDTAEEGHQPFREAAIVQVQGGEPSFAGWIFPESPPDP